MHRTLRIASGALAAEVVPGLGGGLARLDFGDTPLFRPWVESDDPLELANVVLVPWSNRISQPGFTFDGSYHPVSVNHAGGLPLHGNGFQSAWQVAGFDEGAITLTLSSSGPGPYRYEATLRYALASSALMMELSVTNRAQIDLPYGLGFHPWLRRTPRTSLRADFDQVWLERPDHLPDRLVPIETVPGWNFAQSRTLPEGWINNAFRWPSRSAEVQWPELGLRMTLERSEGLDWAVLYSPGATADFVCLEPVSHPVDAFWLPGGAEENGMARLAPNQSLSVWCKFEVIPL